MPSAVLIGAIRTDERVAFLGYNVSETVRYQLELQSSIEIPPAALLDEAFERLKPDLIKHLRCLISLHASYSPFRTPTRKLKSFGASYLPQSRNVGKLCTRQQLQLMRATR